MRKWHQHSCTKVKQRTGNISSAKGEWQLQKSCCCLNLTWIRAQAQIWAKIINCSKPQNRRVCKAALGMMGCQFPGNGTLLAGCSCQQFPSRIIYPRHGFHPAVHMFIAAIAETRLHMLYRECGPASGLGYGALPWGRAAQPWPPRIPSHQCFRDLVIPHLFLWQGLGLTAAGFLSYVPGWVQAKGNKADRITQITVLSESLLGPPERVWDRSSIPAEAWLHLLQPDGLKKSRMATQITNP